MSLNSKQKIKIAVVDDHPLFRDGVVSVLNAEADFEVVAQGSSAQEAIAIANSHKLDLVVLDITMPGNGIEALKALRELHPQLKIVILTVSESEDHIITALKAGASGYISKGISGLELSQRIYGIHLGEVYITPSLAARLLTQMRERPNMHEANVEQSAELTKREEEVLSHVSKGLTNKEIARILELSEKTIKHYMTNVLQKLQARNRVEAVIAIQRRGEREAR